MLLTLYFDRNVFVEQVLNTVVTFLKIAPYAKQRITQHFFKLKSPN
jgi:hypothetical protein